MSLFLASPRDRIQMLSGLVERQLQVTSRRSSGAITATPSSVDGAVAQKAALQTMLLARYLQSMSEASSVVSLLSVMDSPLSLTAAGAASHEDSADLRRLMLSGVVLLLQHAESAILDVLHAPASVPPLSIPPYIAHLREFLLRTQIVVTARAMTLPSLTNPYFAFLVAYVEKVLSASSELMLFCAHVDKWPQTAAIVEAAVISKKQQLAGLWQSLCGSLLLSLLTVVSKLCVHVECVARLLPALQQMLAATDALAMGLPDVVAGEADVGKWLRVPRTIKVASPHPLPAGTTSYVVALPGARRMTLKFDNRVQETISNGGTIEVRDKAGASLIADPTELTNSRSFEVACGEVEVLCNAGYAQVWGMAVTATGVVEYSVASPPFLTDLQRCVALAAAKAAGALCRGRMLASESPKDGAVWLHCELVSVGVPATVDSVMSSCGMEALRPLLFDMGFVTDTCVVPGESPRLEPAGVGAFTAKASDLDVATAVAKQLETLERDHFPVPADAADVIFRAIRAVFATLLRHNHLVDVAAALPTAQPTIKDGAGYAEVVKAWRAALGYVGSVCCVCAWLWLYMVRECFGRGLTRLSLSLLLLQREARTAAGIPVEAAGDPEAGGRGGGEAQGRRWWRW
jgi:hypothetical protein